MIPNEGYAAGNMQGNSAYYETGGLQALLDKLKGGKWTGPAKAIGGFMSGGGAAGKIGGGALSSAATGAQIGTMIAPGVGTAIGAGVGAVAGAVGGALGWKQQQHERQVAALQQMRSRMQ